MPHEHETHRAPRPRGVLATPMQVTSTGWTVYWETEHAFGARGWGLSHAAAVILATKIELGEVLI